MRVLSAVLLWSNVALCTASVSAEQARDRGKSDPTSVRRDPRADLKVEGWRYKWQNGHWWYYQPNGQWLFWNGLSWSDYSPAPYQRWYAGSFGPAAAGRYYTGYRGTGEGYRRYSFDGFDDASTPAQVGQAIIGGSDGSMAERVARVGANW